MKLTEHFTLEELTVTSQKFDNTPDDRIKLNLLKLASELLEPIRLLYGKPLIVNSGYRSLLVNTLIGGSKTSDHMNGLAADLRLNDEQSRELVHKMMDSDLKWDQVIFEGTWLHVGLGTRMRQSVMVMKNGKYTNYSKE